MANADKYVLGLGNPLLDMVAPVPMKFIAKYNLQLNNMYLANPSQMAIYDDIKQNFDVNFVPGGATLNAIRVCQALRKKPFTTGYSGCIGKDPNGQLMHKLLKEENIDDYFFDSEEHPTGTCAVLVHKNDRALCTNLGAASQFPLTHLKDDALQAAIHKADIVYSAGYFLSSCPEAMVENGKYCAEHNKTYILGIAALFIMDFYSKEFKEVLPYADFIIGNIEEYRALSKAFGYDSDDIDHIALKLSQHEKANKLKSRVIVCTQGPDPVLILEKWVGNGLKTTKYPVYGVDPSKIVDVNGAGDAFIGGFVYGLAEGLGYDACCHYGTYAASNVIQRSGCVFDFSDFPNI